MIVKSTVVENSTEWKYIFKAQLFPQKLPRLYMYVNLILNNVDRMTIGQKGAY